MRRRAASHRHGLALAVALLLPASCELETHGTGDVSVPGDASAGGASGLGGRAEAGADRDVLEASRDAGAGGQDPDAASDADAAVICGLDPPATGGPCPLACTSGCWGAKCYIGCATALSCQNELVRCPSGFDCEIGCLGLQSCAGARIQCEAKQSCLVNCVGFEACLGATMHCGNGSCALICQGGSCTNTVMNCGPGDCRSLCFLPPYPTVNCQGACNCTPC
ncbi:MAG TPA: hypothetical protein VK524_09250 [Polyangiaceae bacterium]|nr:hypothetical protein [Polyangiaceae bacterium]